MLLDKQNLDKFMDTIRHYAGISLEDRREIIKQKLLPVASKHNVNTYESMTNRVIVDKNFRQDILNAVTINETYFFRELHQLESAIYYAKSLDTQVHILCIPCSTGDEVYSLGMIAYLQGLDKSKLTITGVDINSDVIAKCEEGIYTQRALQRLSLSQKNVFFEKLENDMYKIKKSMMPLIRFKNMNVFDQNFVKLGKFDIILSRNMLIYFSDDHRIKTINKFREMLNPYGRFYAGNADIIPYSDVFEKRTELGSMFYEKAY